MCYTYLAGLVITDGNGLIYMRVRYYSPDMRRFINADIVAGAISNAVTLNRFAYANGNPVSFVDPFGLSSKYTTQECLSGDNGKKYNMAIYVVDRDWNSDGLPVVGHTRMYFLREDGLWVRTEFTGNIKEGKKSASVKFDDSGELPEMCILSEDGNSFEFIEVHKVQYVVMTGEFAISVAWADAYANVEKMDFGSYNVLSNNCSDYTDALLRAGNPEGTYTNLFSEKEPIHILPIPVWLPNAAVPMLRPPDIIVPVPVSISVPIIRVMETKVGNIIDEKINTISEKSEKMETFFTEAKNEVKNFFDSFFCE